MEESGEASLELLYLRKDLEGAVWSFINWGGISRCLFGALILVERYYKEWRELFEALIIGEGCGGSFLELLYWWRDIEKPVQSSYISGGIL